MSWTLCQERGGDWYAAEEIYLEGSHTMEAAQVLVERVKSHPAGIVVTGDATSKAGQRAASAKSDYDILFSILKDAGINYVDAVPKANPPMKERVNSVNAKLKS